jgi:Holliday junction resolvase RusA-like endonuclease
MNWSEKEYNDYAKKMGIPLANAKLKEPLNTAKHQEVLHTEEVETQPLSNILSFVVKGEPVAKGRPRVSKFGTYTPTKTVNYENWVKQSFCMAYKSHEPTEQPLKVCVIAYFSIPKSKSQKVKLQMLKGRIRPAKKPDIDNVIKSITDALNALAYKDDSQIVEMSAKKYYSDEPRVEISIEEVGA